MLSFLWSERGIKWTRSTERSIRMRVHCPNTISHEFIFALQFYEVANSYGFVGSYLYIVHQWRLRLGMGLWEGLQYYVIIIVHTFVSYKFIRITHFVKYSYTFPWDLFSFCAFCRSVQISFFSWTLRSMTSYKCRKSSSGLLICSGC